MIRSFHVAGFWAVMSWLAFWPMHWFMRIRAAKLAEHRYAWMRDRFRRRTRYLAAKAARDGGYRLCPRCKLERTEESMCQWCAI